MTNHNKPSLSSEGYVCLFKIEICFLYALAVDGLEVVFHRDDGIAVLAPFGLPLGTFRQVGMVAGSGLPFLTKSLISWAVCLTSSGAMSL